MTSWPEPDAPVLDVDCIVIGAGFAGMYAIVRLLREGFRVRAFETGSGVGGTWFWNRYPGARCDVESFDYCYSFSAELDRAWSWSERFATQPEILRYAEFVADHFDLRPHITFETRILGARFDELSSTWIVTTSTGESVNCRFLISAAGALSASQVPQFAGLDDFTGRTLHTGQWPHEYVDLRNKRVAVIGTGSSGMQLIPEIAKQAGHLTVFQRTPNYSIPARNRPHAPTEVQAAKDSYFERRAATFTTRTGAVIPTTGRRILEVSPEDRLQALEKSWKIGGNQFLATFIDTARDLEANHHLAEFVRGKIRAIVTDPVTAEALVPLDYPIGAKRIVVDTDYFETYNLDNVDLVDLRSDPFESFTPQGIRTASGSSSFDVVVLATGFDAMTGPLTRIDIRGRCGASLAETWAAGAKSYLGVAVAGFPNMFTITGPQSPSVLVNVINAIEQHVDWIVEHLCYLRDHDLGSSEAASDAQDAWVEHVAEVSLNGLYRYANSWYLGANIPGKPRIFLPYIGGLDVYRTECSAVAADGYRGFAMRSPTPCPPRPPSPIDAESGARP